MCQICSRNIFLKQGSEVLLYIEFQISKNPHERKSNAMKVLDMNNWDFPEEK